MCSALGVGLGAKLAGSVLQANSAQAHGRAAANADFRSADFADAAAAEAVHRGDLLDLQYALRSSAVEAEQRVQQSGSGSDVNSGGNFQTQKASEAIVEVGRAVVRRNAALEAYGLRLKAGALRQRGVYENAAADNASIGTFLSGMLDVGSSAGKLLEDRTDGDTESSAVGSASEASDFVSGSGFIGGN